MMRPTIADNLATLRPGKLRAAIKMQAQLLGWFCVDQIDPEALSWIRGIGPVSLRQIRTWTASLGVTLGTPGLPVSDEQQESTT